MLHEKEMIPKKESTSDVHMVLTGKETPPPVDLEEPLMMVEPKPICTVKTFSP